MDHRFRSQFEKFVGVERPPTLVVSAFRTPDIVATRVQWQQRDGGHPTQFDRAQGYMLCLQRRDLATQPYWADQRPHILPAIRRGQFLLLDLGVQHSSVVPGDVDCISIYAAQDALRRFSAENELGGTGELRTPLAAVHEDPVIHHLGEALLPAIEHPRSADRLWIDHVALALLARLIARHGTVPAASAPHRGGLAAWQVRRAKELMMAHIDGCIGLQELAAECRLSRSHFARAFKASTGVSPFRWLSAQRIEKAKLLLVNTDLPLEQIAGACGFADASHLTRSFFRAMATTPGSWRRSCRS